MLLCLHFTFLDFTPYMVSVGSLQHIKYDLPVSYSIHFKLLSKESQGPNSLKRVIIVYISLCPSPILHPSCPIDMVCNKSLKKFVQ